ncbi:sortase [Patescibacteria group bacterium]|nr:sortase [Patescibacteria group bacterium]
MDEYTSNPANQPQSPSQPAAPAYTAPPQPPTADTNSLPQEEEQPKKKRSWPVRILKAILPLLVIAALVYVVYNFPALWQRLTYTLHPPKAGNSALLPPTIQGNNPGGIPAGGQGCGADPIDYDGNGNPKQICDNYVYIPKIGVAAPIVRPGSTDEATIDDALLKGVVHYPGTAEPGEKGNVFLTGHSSFYWWVPTKFRNVFTLEPQLENNDEIIIYKNGVRYSYRVTSKFEVAPNEISVLAQTPDSRVTLSTCVPIGTSYKRMIVQAKQVSPDPNRARVPTSQARPPARLPGVR